MGLLVAVGKLTITWDNLLLVEKSSLKYPHHGFVSIAHCIKNVFVSYAFLLSKTKFYLQQSWNRLVQYEVSTHACNFIEVRSQRK